MGSMKKEEYEQLLLVLRSRYFSKGEIDKATYDRLKKELDDEFVADDTADFPAEKEAYEPLGFASLQKGQVIALKYTIIGKIGQGGMAAVYLAENNNDKSKVAIKRMLPVLMSDRDFKERFSKEAETQSRLLHPNIAKIIEFDDVNLIIVQEYIDGENLEKILKRRILLPEAEALRIFKDVLQALNYAHQRGIIHRDVKTSNIIIDKDGNPKITDFGISLIMGEDRKTKTGVSVGTPEYMSPEQIKGEKEIDHRVDVYSSGIVLYEMLTGRLPFGSADSEFSIKSMHINKTPSPPTLLNSNISYELSDIIIKALEKDPDRRYAGCGEFCSIIENYEKKHRDPEPDAENISVKVEEEYKAAEALQDIPSDSSSAGPKITLHTDNCEVILRYCPPGNFYMGSPAEEVGRLENEILHRVEISAGFWILETPVTQGLYKDIMGKNPSYFLGESRPVEMVNWRDAEMFCKRLSSITGRLITLPTEAEWEYACRAGTDTKFNCGDAIGSSMANFHSDDLYRKETTDVCSFTPNAWGLYDMHGNIFEWCLDHFVDYDDNIIQDPVGRAQGLKRHIMPTARSARGGSWFYDASYLRSAARFGCYPSIASYHVGFRFVMHQQEKGEL